MITSKPTGKLKHTTYLDPNFSWSINSNHIFLL